MGYTHASAVIALDNPRFVDEVTMLSVLFVNFLPLPTIPLATVAFEGVPWLYEPV